MFCNKCGNSVDEGAIFCTECGNRLPPNVTIYTHPPAENTTYAQLPSQNQAPSSYGQQIPISSQQTAQYSQPVNSYYGAPPAQKKRGTNAAAIVVAGLIAVAIVCVILAAVLLYRGVSGSGTIGGKINSDHIETVDDREFDILLDELFAEWVSEDTLTMQYFLADPEAMGIERPEPTYGNVSSLESLRTEREETERIKNRLNDITYDMLSIYRRVIYDILSRNLELSTILEENDDFMYYTGYIRPITGIQIQLPVLLAEFRFYSTEDIDLYLALLGDTIRYFDDIIEFERKRASLGFFLSDANLDTVIEQLEEFTYERENCYLITVLDDKIDAYPGLSEQQKKNYKSSNRELVLNNVLVAYDNLLEAMRSLKGVGPSPGGLADLPDGERFAHAMMSLSAGTGRSAQELESLISKWRSDALGKVRYIVSYYEDIAEKYFNDETGALEDGTPEEYLQILQDAMQKDFPAIRETNYSVYEVHKSLQEHISPAFYLTPAVDRFDENVIYINPSKLSKEYSGNLSVFATLAHEGYPGHMYETVYNRQLSPHPIMAALSNTGYSEGWATYAEYYSYKYAGFDELETELLVNNELYFILLQAHVDIGVNMLGWDVYNVSMLLNDDLGIDDIDIAADIYDAVTGIPLNISMYAFGYIEFMLLRDEYEKMKSRDFSYYDFHKYILDFGPAPFPVIRDYMKQMVR